MEPDSDTHFGVITRNVGVVSETFIRRHMTDLLPGETVVVGRHPAEPGISPPDAPTLILDHRVRTRRRRALRKVARLAGFRRADEERAAVARFLRRHGVRTVLVEYLDQAWRWLPLEDLAGVRFFAHAHGYDVSSFLRDPTWVRRYADLRRADGIVVMSRVSAERLARLGLPRERIHVVPYGVELPPPAANAAPDPRGALRCLAVGRMVAKKAPLRLLDAFRRAHAAAPDSTLDYVGGGPILPQAQQYVEEMGLEDAVRLHGFQPHSVVRKLMRDADIFLQHSIVDPETGDEEGLPVAILEAMAHGLPTVATRHAGIPEAVEEGGSGFLVAEGDTAAMAERIVALSKDATLRRRLGARGRAVVEQRFTWERERRELLRVMGLQRD